MSTRNLFFAVLNVTSAEKGEGLNEFYDNADIKGSDSRSGITRDNEWMQEYHIIYNSYILDDKESGRIEK